MWETIIDRSPSGMVWTCTVLSVLIPYTIYKINRKLHKLGDAPWSKEQDNAGSKKKDDKS
jgi:hypothetical protein